MAHQEDKVRKMILEIFAEMGISWKISQITYRDDYQDYYIILDGSHYCALREKLVDVYLADGNPDIKREIEFRIAHPVELEEWEKEDVPGAEDFKKDISVDNSADYDF